MFLRNTLIGAALIAAPIAFAAPAMAGPGMNFDCAPCVADVNNDGETGPIWNEVTSLGPWEPLFNTHGTADAPQGIWEDTLDRSDGVPDNGAGAWERAFPAE